MDNIGHFRFLQAGFLGSNGSEVPHRRAAENTEETA